MVTKLSYQGSVNNAVSGKKFITCQEVARSKQQPAGKVHGGGGRGWD